MNLTKDEILSKLRIYKEVFQNLQNQVRILTESKEKLQKEFDDYKLKATTEDETFVSELSEIVSILEEANNIL